MKNIFDKAVSEYHLGNYIKSEELCRQILVKDSTQPNTLHLLGIIFQQTGDNIQAEKLIREAISFDKRNPQYLKHLGLVLEQNGNPAEGEKVCRKAARLDSNDSEIYNNLGICLESQGKFNEAGSAYDRATIINPKNLSALVNQGNIRRILGNLEEAVLSYCAVLEIHSKYVPALMNLGNLYSVLSQEDNAVSIFEILLSLDPENSKVLSDYGAALERLNCLDEAERKLRLAIRMDSSNYYGFSNLGTVLHQKKYYEEAIDCCNQAIRINPDLAEAYNFLGNILQEQGNIKQAIEKYDLAILKDPNFAGAHFSKSLSLLSLEKFETGLVDYQWRKRKDAKEYIQTSVPFWTGEPLPNQSVLVRKEQGIGDQILYAGLLQNYSIEDTNFTLEVDDRLRGLFSRAMPDITVVSADAGFTLLEECDRDHFAAQIFVADLTVIRSPWPKNYIPQKKYLETDPKLVAKWRNLLGGMGDQPKVGISWRSTAEKIGSSKSLSIESWKPILTSKNVGFVNLQYGDTDTDLSEISRKFGVEVYTDPNLDRDNDIENLAALIDSLDLVITTSNITPHLAGALGKPCWLMLQKTPIWYWGLEGKNNIFYSTLRSYRQRNTNDWGTVVDEVEADFNNWITSKYSQ